MSDPPIKVLLVEDNPGDVGLVRAYLAEEGDVRIELAHVDRLLDGLKLLADAPVDAVLLDLNLPDSEGLDTLRRVLEHSPAIATIVLTGVEGIEQALQAVREGAADYLFKGRIDGPLLIRSIRFAIERAAHRKAAVSLKEAEARYRALVETTTDWIWAVDRKGNYTYCSPKVRDLLGFEPEEVVGKTLYDFVLPSEKERFAALVQKSEACGAPIVRLEHTSLHKDGRQVVLETSAAPVLNDKGELLGYRGIDRDITEVKESQDLLRERERRYRQLLAAVTSYAYSVKVENGMSVSTTHGEGCAAVTGYESEDYEADPGLWHSMIHPDDQEMVVRQVARVLAGEEVPPVEHRILRRDKTIRWVRNTMIPHCQNGILKRYDGLIEDITERRNAERALRDKELQLLTAQRIQEGLLPRAVPKLPGFDIAGALHPAEFAAGDYYDYLPMSDGGMGIVIGDVAGHGFGPALIMASTHVMLRLLVETHDDLGEILTLANSVLIDEIEEERFVTLLFAHLNPATRTLVYSNAGHPPGYVLGSSGEIRARLESTDFPLGIVPDVKFSASDPLALEAGDTVLLLSDGILESRSPEGDFFGNERALEVVRANLHRTAGEIVESLCQAARAFSESTAPVDDTTAVAIKVKSDSTTS